MAIIRIANPLPALARLLFPPCCVFCGTAGPESGLCRRCDRALPRIESACLRCGVPLPHLRRDVPACGACQDRPPPFARTRAAFLYAFPVDSALKALKYNRALRFAPVFASLLLTELERHFPDVEALAPVPLHRWRNARRGFNQAMELARPLARRTGLPLLKSARRIRPTRSQSGLDAAERRRNLRCAFEVRGTPAFAHVLIVDDVMTTGETCSQLARALLKCGVGTVSVLTVARAVQPGLNV